MKNERVVTFSPFAFGAFPIPTDYIKFIDKVENCCGQLAIASALNISVMRVFKRAGLKRSDLKTGTRQKKMIEILKLLGCDVKQKGVRNRFRFPRVDLAIIRVSFGHPDQHWIKTAKLSHYITLKRFGINHYVLDNVKVDGRVHWIELSEYYKVMEADKMFITSYLELKS